MSGTTTALSPQPSSSLLAPKRVVAGDNDEAFAERMIDGYERHREIGTRAMIAGPYRLSTPQQDRDFRDGCPVTQAMLILLRMLVSCRAKGNLRNFSFSDLPDAPVHPMPHHVAIQPFPRRSETLSVVSVEVIGTVK